ncbi:MAG: ABC-2 type transport system permease protein [Chlamydiales bacterium]|jgi:ABC-2 type transport system permease protein
MSPGFLDTAWALAWRTWVKTFRRPVLLTFSFVQPLMWMLFFGFLFDRYELVDFPEGTRYIDFLAPGVCVMTVLFGASQSGIGWIRDEQVGFLARMLQTPASPWAILAGKVCADAARLLVQAMLVLLLALAVGARLAPDLGSIGPGFAALCLFALAFSCLSSAIAFWTRAQEAMAVFVHVVNMPLLFTSSALVPGKQMPDWLARIAAWNPLTLAVDAWRSALLGQGTVEYLDLAPLALLAGFLFLLAGRAMQR